MASQELLPQNELRFSRRWPVVLALVLIFLFAFLAISLARPIRFHVSDEYYYAGLFPVTAYRDGPNLPTVTVGSYGGGHPFLRVRLGSTQSYYLGCLPVQRVIDR